VLLSCLAGPAFPAGKAGGEATARDRALVYEVGGRISIEGLPDRVVGRTAIAFIVRLHGSDRVLDQGTVEAVLVSAASGRTVQKQAVAFPPRAANPALPVVLENLEPGRYLVQVRAAGVWVDKTFKRERFEYRVERELRLESGLTQWCDVGRVVVVFAYDNDQPDAGASERLAGFVRELEVKRQAWRLVVTGHTDSRGTDAYNEDLGLRRARNVASVLEEARSCPVPPTVRTRGAKDPVGPNATDEGRGFNRRVEVVAQARCSR